MSHTLSVVAQIHTQCRGPRARTMSATSELSASSKLQSYPSPKLNATHGDACRSILSHTHHEPSMLPSRRGRSRHSLAPPSRTGLEHHSGAACRRVRTSSPSEGAAAMMRDPRTQRNKTRAAPGVAVYLGTRPWSAQKRAFMRSAVFYVFNDEVGSSNSPRRYSNFGLIFGS